ncbi:MAG: hypothetical protein EXQ52_12145 [Bryobacterales bacterium]|nr:hypothetical protein [Bryobacterales bacterium]
MAGVKGDELPPVTGRKQEELHVRDLVGADQPGPQRVAQVPQIDIGGPILVVGALAVPLKTRQRLPDGVTGSTGYPACGEGIRLA